MIWVNVIVVIFCAPFFNGNTIVLLFRCSVNIKRTPSQRSFYISVNGVAVSGEVS